jgi:NTE family protein
MIKNIVFSGGALKGLCYVGIIQYLEEIAIINKIHNVLGVSIGSVFAMMLCLKMTSRQMGNIISLLSNDDLKDIKSENIFTFFQNYGIDSGIKIEKFAKACVKVKLGDEEATFNNLHNWNPDKTLIVMASEVTTGEREYFSYQHTPNFPIWKAIRASCSLPMYFHPVKHEDKIYIDGGVICNYPIDYFKNDIESSIGVVFKDINLSKKHDVSNFQSYFERIFNIFSQSFEDHVTDIYYYNTCFINLDVNEVSQYNLTRELKEKYYNIGYSEFKREWTSKFSSIEEHAELPETVNDDIVSEIHSEFME